MKNVLSRIGNGLCALIWAILLVEFMVDLFRGHPDTKYTIGLMFFMLYMMYVPRHIRRLAKYVKKTFKHRKPTVTHSTYA